MEDKVVNKDCPALREGIGRGVCRMRCSPRPAGCNSTAPSSQSNPTLKVEDTSSSEMKCSKAFSHPMKTRQAQNSEKSSSQHLNSSSSVDLFSLYSGCVTRGQINRFKKIFGESSSKHEQLLDVAHQRFLLKTSTPNGNQQTKLKNTMKRKHDVLHEPLSNLPGKKVFKSFNHEASLKIGKLNKTEEQDNKPKQIMQNCYFEETIPKARVSPENGRSECSSPDLLGNRSQCSDAWIRRFLKWSAKEKIQVLENLINVCQPHEVRHMLEIIEPQFQRDFISLLPKELALHVLGFLSPKDLLVAAQTCKYWRVLADDDLMWKEKCKEEGIIEPCVAKIMKSNLRNKKSVMTSKWKASYLRHVRIEMNWREGKEKISKVLKGHDDHVITCLQFNGTRIVSGSDDNTLKVWSAVSGKCLRTLTGHTGGVWASQMRRNLIISGSTDRTLKIWNADTGNCVHTLYGHTSTVRCLALHENIVVSGSRDATLRVWDINNGECLHVLIGHMAAVRCVCYDGVKVVSGAYDYMVKVWDPITEECLHTLQGHTNRVYSLQFDGKYIVSGSLDTSIRVWEVENGACLHTLMGHQSLTSGMVLKGNTLVSGNADSTVKVWDILTGECLKTLEGSNKHLSAVTCLQFRGKFVITSSDDGTVKLWDINTGKVIRDLVTLESRGSGGVVWRIRASQTKLVCAFGSRNGTEETKLMVLDFDPDIKC